MFNRQRGLSLVELLVSMFISVVVLGGVVSVIQSSRSTLTNEQEASFIQENVRYAVEILSRDIRSAGNFGCADKNNAHVANLVDGNISGLFSEDSIVGYEGTASTAGFPAILDQADVGSDAIILRYADSDRSVSIQSHSTGSQSFNLHGANTHDFEQGEKIAIVDISCRHIGIFENTSANNAATANYGAGSSPGNCSIDIKVAGGDINCSGAGGGVVDPVGYRNGSFLMPYVANAYYIDDSNVVPSPPGMPGIPALKRRVLSDSGFRTEELAQGVESMELLYGEDTDATPDGIINVYRNADDVADWNNVIAVRFNLVFRSQRELFETNQLITLNGQNYNDRYLRQLASSTVQMRNR
ncbi:PilW family protein [Agarilytica rhodophyticola]|uniref:PilW family protein n=1 Tax=Agarilytica rhodophyticola TaxID=1737490 RepID=UPI0013154445|nr:PilW family protein [Agarilytica rhodophyticola]